MRRGMRHPPSADGLLYTLRENHLDVEPLDPDSRFTPQLGGCHTLYENANRT